MDVFVRIKTDKLDGGITLNGASRENERALIDGIFKVFGVPGESLQNQVKPPVKATSEIEKPVSVPKVVIPEIPKMKVPSADPVKSRPRQVQMIGSENRNTNPIGDVARITKQENSDEPDFYRTGIKHDDDGTKRYKTRYWCECGAKGNHYIPLDTEYVKCHECGNEIDVEPATYDVGPDGVPQRDDYGNFFVARFARQ